jgi:hypothetical protein
VKSPLGWMRRLNIILILEHFRARRNPFLRILVASSEPPFEAVLEGSGLMLSEHN